ncbi:endoplasmic reticulum protein [Dioszegia hungarica]|uniref:Endoplasmic reticulum protein n=1 Tax=Dioszegia hungarica TaxID=4972 RepID=A0AA38LUN7_9TREE|nr:endoplasmic reticulum protein [Dioszegia hungarica]KAI9635144.1 endoplasmic reticulum protein [Dioszegia hungarica]
MSRVAARTLLSTGALTARSVRPASLPAFRAVLPPTSSPTSSLSLFRFKSTTTSSWAKNPVITYEELKPYTQQPTDDVLIVDVREPDEVALGSIPSAVSLPLSQLRDALDKNFGPGEFQKQFAFSKPLTSQNLIFFCRSGKRSATASEWAHEKGYNNVRNYQGSWLDWSKREKESGSDED